MIKGIKAAQKSAIKLKCGCSCGPILFEDLIMVRANIENTNVFKLLINTNRMIILTTFQLLKAILKQFPMQ